jgi:hypothetical protein
MARPPIEPATAAPAVTAETELVVVEVPFPARVVEVVMAATVLVLEPEEVVVVTAGIETVLEGVLAAAEDVVADDGAAAEDVLLLPPARAALHRAAAAGRTWSAHLVSRNIGCARRWDHILRATSTPQAATTQDVAAPWILD